MTTETQTHTVEPGNTLWGLAQIYLGSGSRWSEIYEANEDLIRTRAVQAGLWDQDDPGHWIFPGQVLIIPET